MPRTARHLTVALLLAAAVFSAAAPARTDAPAPAPDQGAAGVWHRLRKLRTTASAMHTTAHPDDEHGGVLTLLSRGHGVRLSLLTLNRGESGDNALGPELFDALGLIRTEELLLADRYYGVDRQYFTTMIDYGFSKRLDETLDKWGRDHVLRDVVRVIRMERPLVLISRFQGNPRDGHGNHEAAGLITQEAYRAAGDPARFPEQLAAGLRPWQPLKLYMGGVRENEDWTIRVDAGTYDPVIGDSYHNLGRLGLSFQRSQTGGQFVPQPGPAVSYYRRLESAVEAPAREASFFDGIDTTLPGLYRALRRTPPAGAEAALGAIDGELAAAVGSFRMAEPSASAPALARALAATRAALRQPGGDPDVVSVLSVKEEQIQEAIAAALGISFSAMAQPAGTVEPTGPGAAFARPAAMPPVVPGQAFQVKTTFVNRSPVAVAGVRISLETKEPWGQPADAPPRDAPANVPLAARFDLTVPRTAPLTRPWFTRPGIQETRYAVADQAALYRPAAEPALVAAARFEVDGVPVTIREPVRRLEANLPYGFDTRVLAVVPPIGITVDPAQAVVPLGMSRKQVTLRTEVLNNVEGKSEGTVRLAAPVGWTVEPASQPFSFGRAGERGLFAFTVTIPSLEDREYRIEAVAASGGREFREGYQTIRHRDLETRYLYRDASAAVRGVDVRVPAGLKVGYVMGIGDAVPSGLRQLGAEVELLGAQALASGDLSRFDTIVTGTRAYAVREDLRTYNRRLLDYVRNGGNLIVLYNTQELVPAQYAPFPGQLTRDAEEVSEEDSPVEILAPADPVFNTPNRITKADFDGWVEQRGSKFWSAWDPAYTALVASHDRGQAPQQGGWLHATYGKGHYTYFAYAFHRQLPYGVPGAYRLLANLLSLNRPEGGAGR